MSIRDWLPTIPALRRVQKASPIGGVFDAATISTAPVWTPENYGAYYFTSVPAYRAINLRSQSVAMARLKAYRVISKQGEDEFQPVEETDPIQELIDRVNPWHTQSDLWRITETYFALFGAAYWYLARDGGKRFIWPLHPSHTRPVPAKGKAAERFVSHYIYQRDGREMRLEVDDVVRFWSFNPTDELGTVSPIAPGRLSLDMNRDALMYNRNFFKNGTNAGNLAFVWKDDLTDEQVDSFYRRLKQKFAGADNAHKPYLLHSGGDAKNLGLTNKDMEFLASLNWGVEDAARIWGVPPPLMYSQTSSIYNNVKQAQIDFWQTTVWAQWRYYESILNERFLPQIGAEGYVVRFDSDHILPLQEGMADLKESDREDVKQGILTVNEVRASRGLEPVDWGDEPRSVGFGGFDEFEEGYKPITQKSYDRDIEVFANAFVDTLRMRERQFESVMRRLFDEQGREIIKRLREGTPAAAVFKASDWIDPFSNVGKPLMLKILVEAAEVVGRRFRLVAGKRDPIPKPPAFDPTDPKVLAWLSRRVSLWATLVNEETGKLVVQAVTEATVAGEGIPQIQDRLERIFRFNNVVRSERIARTETLGAANQGHLSMYEQSNVVERIRWVATADDRVRESHAQADGQVVELGQPFKVGGVFLEAPGVGVGGTLGDPAQTVNCRCVTVPVLVERRDGGNIGRRPAERFATIATNGHSRP